MQLKRQSVEAWQNENHLFIQKGIIPVRTQSQDKKFSKQSDRVKYKGQVRSRQVTTFVV